MVVVLQLVLVHRVLLGTHRHKVCVECTSRIAPNKGFNLFVILNNGHDNFCNRRRRRRIEIFSRL